MLLNKVVEKALRRTKFSEKSFYIGQTEFGLYVLRDGYGKEVSPALSDLRIMFKWCNHNNYIIYDNNPLRRKKKNVRNRRKK